MSQGYLDSGNCVHEAQQMVAQLDNKKMKFVPVSLADANYEMPPWLSIIQALVWTSDKSADDVVQEIVKSLDE